ncbi:hypothetical protein [Streptomyces sp. SID3212]|uniref:hypothetical protein n=1 Tax=Streptomyces sp. SID3212 TaxID=2690259 RepID=UPI00136FCD8A|nr:hypothetical protein [Streptomyces sp. SID3212]MYV58004.1 hypothetical protein [Streptomyces sp. SID3212]
MIYMVTWTDPITKEVGGVSAGTEFEAETVYHALVRIGIREVALWTPRQVAVMVNDAPAGLIRKTIPAVQQRVDKGCTHPVEEPCLGKPRLEVPGAGPEYDGREGLA